MPSGIRDKVAILGMGCSKFGERWDCDADDLIIEAYEECLADAGIETSQIDMMVRLGYPRCARDARPHPQD